MHAVDGVLNFPLFPDDVDERETALHVDTLDLEVLVLEELL